MCLFYNVVSSTVPVQWCHLGVCLNRQLSVAVGGFICPCISAQLYCDAILGVYLTRKLSVVGGALN